LVSLIRVKRSPDLDALWIYNQAEQRQEKVTLTDEQLTQFDQNTPRSSDILTYDKCLSLSVSWSKEATDVLFVSSALLKRHVTEQINSPEMTKEINDEVCKKRELYKEKHPVFAERSSDADAAENRNKPTVSNATQKTVVISPSEMLALLEEVSTGKVPEHKEESLELKQVQHKQRKKVKLAPPKELSQIKPSAAWGGVFKSIWRYITWFFCCCRPFTPKASPPALPMGKRGSAHPRYDRLLVTTQASQRSGVQAKAASSHTSAVYVAPEYKRTVSFMLSDDGTPPPIPPRLSGPRSQH